MKHTTLRDCMKKNKKSLYGSKNLSKLNNGYVLEFNSNGPHDLFAKEKIIFSVFFNKFKEYYVVQELRENFSIRRDKDRCSTKNPYIIEIFNKSDPKEKLFEMCFRNLEELVERDMVSEKSFDRKENVINKFVQDYFHEELYVHLSQPTLNDYINRGKRNEK